MGSDSGHSGGNAAFGTNNEALVNFGYAQLKKTKDVAVALMQAYYASGPSRVYFAGSSQGGREGATVAQRFPNHYDGVFSRVPVLNFTALQLAGNRMGAPTLAASGGWMNSAKRTLLTNATFAACDALDGLADGLVAKYEGCRFDPAALRCAGGADTGDTCLSDAQIAAVNTLHSPLTFDFPLANGVTSYPGLATGHEAASWGQWTMGAAPPPAVQPTGTNPGGALIVNFGAQTIRYFLAGDPALQTYTFDHNSLLWRARIQQVSAIVDSTDPDLAAFAAHGKLILQEHFGDYAQSPFAGVNYYKSIVVMLGKPATDAFARLYVTPGAEHGGANAPSQVDMITSRTGSSMASPPATSSSRNRHPPARCRCASTRRGRSSSRATRTTPQASRARLPPRSTSSPAARRTTSTRRATARFRWRSSRTCCSTHRARWRSTR